jgi:hypothetical protein
MHYMHDLKDLLCAELEDFAEKGKKSGKMSMGDLETVHKLTDTVKNILKIDMLEEESGYSEDGHYMGEGRIYGTSYESGYSERGGSSYARGRGRNARRDSMGRYSRDGGMSYDDDMSYARGGRMGNRSGRRGYSRDGGYSMDDGKQYMMERLGELMDEASTPTEREALKKCMQALERA